MANRYVGFCRSGCRCGVAISPQLRGWSYHHSVDGSREWRVQMLERASGWAGRADWSVSPGAVTQTDGTVQIRPRLQITPKPTARAKRRGWPRSTNFSVVSIPINLFWVALPAARGMASSVISCAWLVQPPCFDCRLQWYHQRSLLLMVATSR